MASTLNMSRWRGAHEKFPAHVEEARNSDGNVHKGYNLLEFRVAAELLRIGPYHSTEDHWAPVDWQLLLVVSEYMSALLEFLDWFWPELGWEHHKQAIVLSKRLLQPRSTNTYASLPIDPQLHAAWRAFTYCFWHGTRHLASVPPVGISAATYNSVRDWLGKLVGERGYEEEGPIASSLSTWTQAMQPRLREAFPGLSVDWSQWPAVSWPDADAGCRSVEKRGAVKRQTEEEYAVRWPLRVTQGRPKFNHAKVEARDGFVVAIPSMKNPPVLSFLAVSDLMTAFKQAATRWPTAPTDSTSHALQQELVQSFVQNVLRSSRGPLAPGVAHGQFKYLGFVACCVLGWQSALPHLASVVRETASWGPQPLALPGGPLSTGGQPLLMPQPVHPPHHPQQQHHHQQHLMMQQQHVLGQQQADAVFGLGIVPNHGMMAGGGTPPAEGGLSLGIAEQLALMQQQEMQMQRQQVGVAGQAPPPYSAFLQQPQLPMADAGAHGASAVGNTGAGLDAPSTSGQGAATAPDAAAAAKVTRTRPSPFGAAGARRTTAAAATSAGTAPAAQQQQSSDGSRGEDASPAQASPQAQHAGQEEEQQQQQPGHVDHAAPMSLGGLSSMQDLIDVLPEPSNVDLSWSLLLGTNTLGGATTLTTLTGAGTTANMANMLLEVLGGEDARGGAALPPCEAAAAAAAACSGPTPPASPAPPLPPGLLPGQHQPTQQLGAATTRSGQSGLTTFNSAVPYGSPYSDTAATAGPLGGFSSLPLGVGTGMPRGSAGCGAPPDAPVHIQPPCLRAGSPFQGIITTGALPLGSGTPMEAASPPLDFGMGLGMGFGAIPGGLHGAAAQAGGAAGASGCTEPQLTRRSHGEVYTSMACSQPVGPGAGGGCPCPPCPGGGRVSDSGAPASPGGPFARWSQDGAGNRGVGRRTREDVAAAAAAAAAEAGLAPAPGSVAEPSAKRPNAQADPSTPRSPVVTAERVESLGAYLTDEHVGAGLHGPMGLPHQLPAQQHRLARTEAGPPAASEASQPAQLRARLLQLLREAEEVAVQLAAQDPDGVREAVAEAMRENSVLASCAAEAVQGGAGAGAGVPEAAAVVATPDAVTV